MGDFQKALAAVGSIKTPITVTALIVVVFYYLVRQILSLNIFSVLTQPESSIGPRIFEGDFFR